MRLRFLLLLSPLLWSCSYQEQTSTKIIGDLNWQDLRTVSDWRTRFPGCFKEASPVEEVSNLYASGDTPNTYNPNCSLKTSGITFYIGRLKTVVTRSGIHLTEQVVIHIPDLIERSAFKKALEEKYPTTVKGESIICSKESCFNIPKDTEFFGPTMWVEPTDQSTSILGSIKINSRDI